MTNGWKDAEDWPPITMSEDGRSGTSDSYPLMLEGHEEWVRAWVYQSFDGKKIWTGFTSYKKPLKYCVLPSNE